MPAGPPQWSSTIRVSGKARARSVSSPICGWNSQASKLRPSGARHANPLRKVASSSSPFGRVAYMPATLGSEVPGGGMANSAEASVAGGDLRLQHRLGAVAEQQVDVADDAGAHRALAIAAARRHRRDAIGELDFADGAERLGSAGAVHRAAVDIDGGDDVVAGGHVGRHVLDHVAQATTFPEMMVRVDDRARRVDDFLGVLRQPVFAWVGKESAAGEGDSSGSHESFLPLLLFCVALSPSLRGAERRSNPCIRVCRTMDCFAALAMTLMVSRVFLRLHPE